MSIGHGHQSNQHMCLYSKLGILTNQTIKGVRLRHKLHNSGTLKKPYLYQAHGSNTAYIIQIVHYANWSV